MNDKKTNKAYGIYPYGGGDMRGLTLTEEVSYSLNTVLPTGVLITDELPKDNRDT